MLAHLAVHQIPTTNVVLKNGAVSTGVVLVSDLSVAMAAFNSPDLSALVASAREMYCCREASRFV